MKTVIALAGQPNTGKSTLFNVLTGSRQHVGNWPGKTVEKKTGFFTHKGRILEIIDLPGSYSLSANSPEEKITRDYILEEKPDCIVVTVDGSQMERTLFMLAEVCQLPVPVILAVTMVDIAAGLGEEIITDKLAEMSGVDVVALNVTKGYGLDEFHHAVEHCLAASSENKRQSVSFHPLARELGAELDDLQYPLWSSGKLLEGDSDILNTLSARYPSEKWQKIEQVFKAKVRLH